MWDGGQKSESTHKLPIHCAEQYKGNVPRTDPPLNLLACILNLLLTTGATHILRHSQHALWENIEA
jgi:hypothetical protein